VTTANPSALVQTSKGEAERGAWSPISRLQTILAQAKLISSVDSKACRALAAKIAQHAFNLVVVGEFKRGKSTVINALLGSELLPTGVVPLTSVVTILQHGTTPGATVYADNSDPIAIPLDALGDYVTERGNPKNVKHVREVVVEFPADSLRDGLRLVDTPGIGSVHQHNTDVTYRYLPHADAVIFVASADQPMSRGELDFLAEVRRYADKVLCLLNKIDYLALEEQAESVAFAARAATDALGTPVQVFPISARMALQAQTGGRSDLLSASGMPQFEEILRQFLMQERGEVWLASVRQQSLRLLAEGRLSAELELRALSSPIALLYSHLKALSAKKVELVQNTTDAGAVLDAEVRRMVAERVEPELVIFKQRLAQQLQTELKGWYESLRDQGSAALRAELEARTLASVRGACEIWQAETDATTSSAFESLTQRLTRRVQGGIDEVLRYFAELFAIPFTPIAAESLWSNRSGFQVKSWDEPPGLKMLTHSLTAALPRPLGHPLILRDARQRASDLADMHAGRLRHEFEERIRSNARTFQQELWVRIDDTLAGIESAIEQGRRRQVDGETVTTPRRTELASTLARIQALEERAQQCR